ncbi:MAG: hypothetical protein U9N52_06870 [Campylobacterota bacterium]|nr:hypothetical protein [Campylobacterota bacterium]
MKSIFFALITVLTLNAAATPKEKADYLGDMKNLVVATQKTRGGTYNFLNGSTIAQFGVYEERTKIKNHIRSLRLKTKIAGPTIDKEFDVLKKHLKSTNKMAFKLDSLIAFQAYSSLVKRMLKIGQETQKHFYAKGGKLNNQVSHLMMFSILPLTDGLGKLRGLGSGIIARTECEEEEVALMQSYIEEINIHLKNLNTELRIIGKKYPKLYPKNIFNKYTKLSSEISAYINFANTKVIDKSNIDEDPNRYFDEGAHLIKSTAYFFNINQQILSN